MANQNQALRSDQTAFNVKEFFFKNLRFLPLFLLSVIFSLVIAFLYLRYTAPSYSASGSLILKDDKGKGGSSTDKFQELFVDDRSKNIQNEVEYLKSRPLMERVVEGLNLNFSVYAKGKIKEQNTYKTSPFRIETLSLKDSAEFSLNIYFKSDNGFTVGKDNQTYTYGQNFRTPYGEFRLAKLSESIPNNEYRITWQPTSTVASALVGKLAVAPKTGGSILVMSLEADNPYLASDVVNRLMVAYQASTIEDKNATTRQTL
ncbi:MAG: hypothetical protein JWP27_1706, partial [Flaviaesturariibacter sp.]|nr:hypothetical protein [Flaviaesturariibacter sp.]